MGIEFGATKYQNDITHILYKLCKQHNVKFDIFMLSF